VALRKGAAPPGDRILGVPFQSRPLRVEAERELRACAVTAPSQEDKVRFVDAANAVRPITLF
jgi:serine/threonine-protein kinase PknG